MVFFNNNDNILLVKKKKKNTLKSKISLFVFRCFIFASLQLVFYLGPSNKKIHLDFQYNIAISSFCWIVITIIWSAIEGFKALIYSNKSNIANGDNFTIDEHTENNIESDDDNTKINCEKQECTSCIYCQNHNIENNSILLIPQTDWYTQKLKTKINIHCDNCNAKNINSEFKLFITPWALWFYVYACGISLFVLGYSIHGMSMLPQISTIIASIIIWPWIRVDSTNKKLELLKQFQWWFSIENISSLGICISLCLTIVDDLIVNPHIWILWVANNLWMGIIVPVMCSCLLCKCSQQANLMKIPADKVLMFAMPSLAMTSVTFLSIYFPMHGYFSYNDLFNVVNNESTNFFSLNSLPTAGHYFLNSSGNSNYIFQNESFSINNLTLPENSNDNIDMSSFYYWGNYTQSFIEKFIETKVGWNTHPFQGFLAEYTGISIFFIIISPFFLWFNAIAIIGASIKSISGIQSNLSGMALVTVIKQLILGEKTFCVILGVIILLPSCFFSIYSEVLFDDYRYAAKKGCYDREDEIRANSIEGESAASFSATQKRNENAFDIDKVEDDSIPV